MSLPHNDARLPYITNFYELTSEICEVTSQSCGVNSHFCEAKRSSQVMF